MTAAVVAGMTTSADGFVADVEGRIDRLYADLADLRDDAWLQEPVRRTGAVLMGRRTTFVDGDVVRAVDVARRAAADRDVHVVGGADVIGQLLRAGLVDELHLDVTPVLLGDGLRLLPRDPTRHADLDLLDVRRVGGRTSLRFAVRR
ncbi:dihydrofolate reductase family protein [Thalassiella azotivora]